MKKYVFTLLVIACLLVASQVSAAPASGEKAAFAVASYGTKTPEVMKEEVAAVETTTISASVVQPGEILAARAADPVPRLAIALLLTITLLFYVGSVRWTNNQVEDNLSRLNAGLG